MSRSDFKLHKRFIDFKEKVTFHELKSVQFIFYLSGWFFTFLFLMNSIENELLSWMILWTLMYSFFWFHLNNYILKKFEPPVELILICILGFYFIEYLLANNILDIFSDPESNLGEVNLLLDFMHKFFLALYILFYGLLLIINTSEENLPEISAISHINNFKQGILVYYIFWGFIAHYIIFYDHEYYLYFFQIFLLLILLNKTSWLEKLTKKELWIYFIIFLVIFYNLHYPEGTKHIKYVLSSHLVPWFSIPLYLYSLTCIYFLVLLIKIPIVVIYNHASLSRKLWISGLFQSTFPQLIQFIFLLIVFYFFIASWQSEGLRNNIYQQFRQIKEDGSARLIKDFFKQQGNLHLALPDYKQEEISENIPDQGVIVLAKSIQTMKNIYQRNDYFVYLKEEEDLYIKKIDSIFCTNLSSRMSVLVGSGIMIYSYTPKKWQSSVYEWSVLGDSNSIKIYPFDAISNNELWAIRTNIDYQNKQNEMRINYIANEMSDRKKLVFGRILIPMANYQQVPAYLVFDIYLNIKNTLSSSSVMKKFFLSIIIIFLLFNSFIIRRVVKFGSQINKIIIQKFNQLKIGIKKISAGNFDYKFQLEGEDEFVELAGHFNEMGERLKITIDKAREKDRLDQELKIAHEVQLNLLPRNIPEIPGYNIGASLQTATEIGGDFYDILALEDNCYLYSIGDVSGKGSSAAFYMAQFISLLRLSYQFSNNPREIAEYINRYFVSHVSDQQIFVTAIIGFLNASKNRIRFIRAGHVKPIIIRKDKTKEIREILTGGLGIGLTREQKKFKQELKVHEMTLNEGDKIVFYTDGLVEAAKPSSNLPDNFEIYGEERLINMLTKHRDKNAPQLIDEIQNDLNNFYAGNPAVDDYTLLIIQRM